MKEETKSLQANSASTICNDVVASRQPSLGNMQMNIRHTASNILPPPRNFREGKVTCFTN
jgi:hypothetical protein